MPWHWPTFTFPVLALWWHATHALDKSCFYTYLSTWAAGDSSLDFSSCPATLAAGAALSIAFDMRLDVTTDLTAWKLTFGGDSADLLAMQTLSGNQRAYRTNTIDTDFAEATLPTVGDLHRYLLSIDTGGHMELYRDGVNTATSDYAMSSQGTSYYVPLPAGAVTYEMGTSDFQGQLGHIWIMPEVATWRDAIIQCYYPGNRYYGPGNDGEELTEFYQGRTTSQCPDVLPPSMSLAFAIYPYIFGDNLVVFDINNYGQTGKADGLRILVRSDGTLVVEYYVSLTKVGEVTTDAPLDLNYWATFLVTLSAAGDLELHLDGVQQGTTLASGTAPPELPRYIQVGGLADETTDRVFKGLIEDVYVFHGVVDWQTADGPLVKEDCVFDGYVFDGSGVHDLDSTCSKLTTNAGTISVAFTIRVAAAAHPTERITILRFGEANQAVWAQIEASTGELVWRLQTTNSDQEINTGDVITGGQTHHIFCQVMPNGYIKVFVDGVFMTRDTDNSPPLHATWQLRLGGDGSAGQLFTGTLEDVLLWDSKAFVGQTTKISSYNNAWCYIYESYVGNSKSFDGSTTLTLLNECAETRMLLSQSIAFTARVDTGGAANRYLFAADTTGADDELAIYIEATTGFLVCEKTVSGTTASVKTSVSVVGETHRFLCIFGGSGYLQLTMDGVQEAEANGPVSAGVTDRSVGGFGGKAGQAGFEGVLQDVMFWDWKVAWTDIAPPTSTTTTLTDTTTTETATTVTTTGTTVTTTGTTLTTTDTTVTSTDTTVTSTATTVTSTETTLTTTGTTVTTTDTTLTTTDTTLTTTETTVTTTETTVTSTATTVSSTETTVSTTETTLTSTETTVTTTGTTVTTTETTVTTTETTVTSTETTVTTTVTTVTTTATTVTSTETTTSVTSTTTLPETTTTVTSTSTDTSTTLAATTTTLALTTTAETTLAASTTTMPIATTTPATTVVETTTVPVVTTTPATTVMETTTVPVVTTTPATTVMETTTMPVVTTTPATTVVETTTVPVVTTTMPEATTTVPDATTTAPVDTTTLVATTTTFAATTTAETTVAATTTEPVATTTEPAVTTTALGETTTVAVTTTVPVASTTEPAATTTERDETTTEPAATTTVPSATTTVAATTTTPAAVTSTAAVMSTVAATTTTPPAFTTTAAAATTTAAGTTTPVPATTTAAAGATTTPSVETTSAAAAGTTTAAIGTTTAAVAASSTAKFLPKATSLPFTTTTVKVTTATKTTTEELVVAQQPDAKAPGALDFVVLEVHLSKLPVGANVSAAAELGIAAAAAAEGIPLPSLASVQRGQQAVESSTDLLPAPEAEALVGQLQSAAGAIATAVLERIRVAYPGASIARVAVRLGSATSTSSTSKTTTASSSTATTRTGTTTTQSTTTETRTVPEVKENLVLQAVEREVTGLLEQLVEKNVTSVKTEIEGATMQSTRLEAIVPTSQNGSVAAPGDSLGFLKVTVPLAKEEVLPEIEVRLPTVVFASLQKSLPEGERLAMVVTVPEEPEAMGGASDDTGRVVEVSAAVVIDITTLTGGHVNISDLETPIEFSLPTNYRPDLTCAFWDEELEIWSQEGVSLSKDSAPGSPIRCATWHLSLFGAIFAGFLQALLCSQLTLLNLESIQEMIKGTWYQTPGAILFWCLLTLMFGIFLSAAVIDWRRAEQQKWRNEFFLIPMQDSGPKSDDREEELEEEIEEEEEKEEKDEWTVHNVGYILCFTVAFLTACSECCRETALRDALDEIASEYFEQFAEVRNALEGLWQGMEFSAVGSGRLFQVSQQVAQQMVITSSRRLVGATMGLNSEVVCFVLDDKELLEMLQEHKSKMTMIYRSSWADSRPSLTFGDEEEGMAYPQVKSDLEAPQAAAGDTGVMPQRESLVSSAPDIDPAAADAEQRAPLRDSWALAQEQAFALKDKRASAGENQRASCALRSSGGFASAGGTDGDTRGSELSTYSRFSKPGMTTPWYGCDNREDAWAALHDEILDHMQSHVAEHSWWSVPRMVCGIFMVHNPVGSICARNIFMSCKMRAFFHMLELTGDVLIVCIFYSASGSARGKSKGGKAESEEDPCGESELSEELAYKMGRILAIALGSILIAGLPVSLLKSLHTRHFKKLPWEGCDAWKKQLLAWQIQDKMIWVFGLMYFVFGNWFIALFLANINLNDHEDWTTTGLISLVQDAILMPLGIAFLMPTLAAAMLSGVSAAARQRRSSIIQSINHSVHQSARIPSQVEAQVDAGPTREI